MKINLKAFSLSMMIFFAFLIFIFGLWYAATGFGKEFIKVFESIHPDFTRIQYDETVSTFYSIGKNIFPIFINIIWSLIDGLIVGICIGGLYNFFVNREEKRKLKQKELEEGEA